MLLTGAWLLIGLFGHDPWKPDEAYTFGLVWNLLEGGSWIVPGLAGEPFLEKPPLFPLVAALFARAFGWLLPLHDAARLASAMFMAIALVAVARCAEVLHGRSVRWTAVLVLVGSVGLWDRSHQLITDTALFAGIAVAAYGLALAFERPVASGIALGTGTGIAFMAKGLLGPGVVGVTVLLLLAFPPWRSRLVLKALAVAALAALPWLIVWPWMLWKSAPEHFQEWLLIQNFGRFAGTAGLGPSSERFFYLKNLPWITWPAWPLAAWTLYLRSRGFNGGLLVPGIAIPVAMAAATLLVLGLAADARALYAMPLLVPLALLASAEIETVQRGISAALDWFGILFFGLGALVLWVFWLQSVSTGMAPAVASLFRDAERGYRGEIVVPAVVVSVFLTVLWIALVRPARRSNRRAVLNWAVGMTLVWGLFMTLWLPYQDSRKSYRSVAAGLRSALPSDAGCLASRSLGEPQRASLHYFAGILTMREELQPGHGCAWILVQTTTREPESTPPGFDRVWEGHRPGDALERYRLYRRRAG